jgi:hypothetical protein
MSPQWEVGCGKVGKKAIVKKSKVEESKRPKIEVKDETPLRWPEGWSRTLIEHRKTQASWKRPYHFYRDVVIKELERMGVMSVTISRNDAGKEVQDTGVAVWFSIKPTDDFSWQMGLQLDSPAPSLDEIDSAYRRLVQKHHPDAVANGSGGDIQMFHRLTDYRKKARAWVLGQNAQAMDNCIPCDRFTDVRQNLAAIRSALGHFRGLDRVGIPAILERVMSTAFKAQLPQKAGASSKG